MPIAVNADMRGDVSQEIKRRARSALVLVFILPTCLSACAFPRWDLAESWCVHHPGMSPGSPNDAAVSVDESGKLELLVGLWIGLRAAVHNMPSSSTARKPQEPTKPDDSQVNGQPQPAGDRSQRTLVTSWKSFKAAAKDAALRAPYRVGGTYRVMKARQDFLTLELPYYSIERVRWDWRRIAVHCGFAYGWFVALVLFDVMFR
jgi:hypothetical protein